MSRPMHAQFWYLPGRSSVVRMHKHLQSIAGLKAVNSYSEQFTFLDSVDWRLYRKGWALQASRHGELFRLNLIEVPSGKMLAVAPTDSIPDFISDIPVGILYKQLYKAVYPRAFIPICHLRLKRHEYIFQNDEGKQCLRVFLDQPQACQVYEAKPKKLGNWLAIEPVKGYEKETEKIVRLLVKQFKLERKETCMLIPCLTALGVQPVFKESKVQFELSYGESLPVALQRILLALLEMMCSNETGLKEQIDSEFLHDYRIAVRQTRSLLGQMKKIISPQELQIFNHEYAWLSTLTGPARDYDVMLLEFADYQAIIPNDKHAEFKALRTYLEQQRDHAYNKLINALESSRYIELKQKWREFLQSKEFVTGIGSQYKVGKFINKRIGRVYKQVLAEGESMTAESPVESFHQLRKSCKKLRYLLEMFRGLYPADKVKVIINELKKLQDDLGELQDLEVHAEILQNFLTRKINNKEKKYSLNSPIQRLIEEMHARKLVIMENFHAKFSIFASKKDKRLFVELLRLKAL